MVEKGMSGKEGRLFWGEVLEESVNSEMWF
jgi:hypothetical protein